MLLLVLFIAVAGYKLTGYQEQLRESNEDKARLNSVLARSRATESSELKVIHMPRPALSSESNGSYTSSVGVDSVVASMQSEHSDAETQSYLTTFFARHPHSELLKIETVKCEHAVCEIVGEYDGTESELYELVGELEKAPWWAFSSPVLTTEMAQHGVKLNVSFSAKTISTNPSTASAG